MRINRAAIRDSCPVCLHSFLFLHILLFFVLFFNLKMISSKPWFAICPILNRPLYIVDYKSNSRECQNNLKGYAIVGLCINKNDMNDGCTVPQLVRAAGLWIKT